MNPLGWHIVLAAFWAAAETGEFHGAASPADRAHHARVKSPADEHSLRQRTVTHTGVFVVTDAAPRPGSTVAGRRAYAMWWRGFAGGPMLVYDRLVGSQREIDEAALRLAQELGYDVFAKPYPGPAEPAASGKEGGSAARGAGRQGSHPRTRFPTAANEAADGPRWHPVSRAVVWHIMGYAEPPPLTAEALEKFEQVIHGAPHEPGDGAPEPEIDPELAEGDAPPWLFKDHLDPVPACNPVEAYAVTGGPGGDGGGDGGETPTFDDWPMVSAVDVDATPDDVIVSALEAGDCGCTGGCCRNCDLPCRTASGCDCLDPCCGNPDRCCGGGNECCGSPDPCCDTADPCCGNPDRCCNPDNPCCGSTDPCCNTGDDCCGDPDRCCNHDNPCCLTEDPCCNSGDDCCGDADPCCNTDNPCCWLGYSSPCCTTPDPCCNDPSCDCESGDRCCPDGGAECCGSPDPCCDPDDACCGDPDPCCHPDNPCCGVSSEPCCDTPDPCCNDPNPCCGVDCDDGNDCTDDFCDSATGACSHICIPVVLASENCSCCGTILSSLEWETFEDNTPLDNCSHNGDRRIFPGKQSHMDGQAAKRRKVKLVARVSPAKAGCQIYYRVWDVDDPFDQNNAAMPNVSVIDNNTSGPDNRPTPEAPVSFVGTTDDNGVAVVTFTVSMQPGNNYRAGTSRDQAALNAATQAQADANNPPANVRFSPMLTVWRKLHVEVDSMAVADFTNSLTGMIPSAPTYDAATGRAWIPLVGLDEEFRAPDQHRVGRMNILTYGSFSTDKTDISGTPYKVQIVNAPPDIVNAAGSVYTLWDDDAGSVGGFIMVGFDAPPVTLPKVPDTGLMAQVFRNAYVDVLPPDMQYYDANTPFDKNVRNDGEAVTKGDFNRDLTSEAAFWVVHITSAFQGFVAKDGDPDTEQAGPGLQYGLTGVTGIFGGGRSGSLVFLETIRDDKRANANLMTIMERYTVVHEAGHQCLLEHSDGRWPPSDTVDPAGDYIMTDVLDQTAMAPNVAFSAVSLKKIRVITYPPQGN